MSALEETYWAAYFRDDPFGDYRADIRNAQLLQLQYNIHAGKKASKKTLTDWMPFFRRRIKEDENVTDKVRTLFGEIVKHQGKK
jgi:hypothetical protein